MTSNHKEIRWGVIGAGDVCKVKSAPAMNKIPQSRMVAVMRRDEKKARLYASDHNVPRWYDDADKLLADPEVNAVYIATPPHVHAELTRKAAEAGKPVYVEKPMARSYRECLEMIETCGQAGVPLFVAYYRRMLPNYRKIIELVDDGVIGEVRSVDIRMSKPVDPEADRDPANWRVDPDVAGGGYFYDLASHQLDFLDYLLGPIADASGFASNQAGYYRAEDIVSGSFRFENGVLGTGNWCFTTAASAKTDLTTITGSRGVISYPTFAGYYVDLTTDTQPDNGLAENDPVDNDPAETESRHLRSSNEIQTEKKGENSSNTVRFHFDMPEHIQQPLIETIVKELLEYYDGRQEVRMHNENDPSKRRRSGNDTVTRCPSTGMTAARTNRVMEALVKHS